MLIEVESGETRIKIRCDSIAEFEQIFKSVTLLLDAPDTVAQSFATRPPTVAEIKSEAQRIRSGPYPPTRSSTAKRKEMVAHLLATVKSLSASGIVHRLKHEFPSYHSIYMFLKKWEESSNCPIEKFKTSLGASRYRLKVSQPAPEPAPEPAPQPAPVSDKADAEGVDAPEASATFRP